ncbi:MAG: hypothetical protein A2289_02595 [Deltaproteobacteria bacterium RIFOXYA12_FULL_58_15]|nr:MAG: hypothetical protein A2289_02595 [Deltaproteobacteria bacterium RIFOXYA12_FULL_58_15]
MQHTCALLDTGALKCWGSDNYGQLGDGGTNIDQSAPMDVTGLSTGVIAVAAGGYHTCALLDTGALKCWGYDNSGQLGDGGTNTNQNMPVDVAGLSSGVVAIAMGSYHACALLDTGALKCWGNDNYGQIGDGGTNTNQNMPVDVAGLSSGVVAIAAGGYHTCALLDTGALKCWGYDNSGQLGDGGTNTSQNMPVDVAGLSTGVVAVAAGRYHTCALLDTGALKCWGGDETGQLGDGGTNTNQNMPVDVAGLSTGVVAVTAGGDHNCAILDTDALKCWGYDDYGQLGNGDTNTDQSTPVFVSGLSAEVVAITAGGVHTCAILDNNALECWGYDGDGQLGDGGTNTDQSTPVSVSSLSTGVIDVAAGLYHTCAILDTGALKCWGRDETGQLGNGAMSIDQSTPVDVTDLSSGVVAVATGDYHTCAVLDTGTLKCWGSDNYGQLGDGVTNTNKTVPVTITGVFGEAKAVAAGYAHTCAILDTGRLMCWGFDGSGQLGDGGTNTSQGTPVNVVGMSTGVVSVTAGDAHTCALLNTGALKCWGFDHFGQLGDGDTNTSQGTPVDVAGLSTGVIAVAAGSYHTCALLDTGAIKCWGSDNFGQLGDEGTNTSQGTPVDVAGLSSGVVAIAAGGPHTCALLDTGVLKCWGHDFRGQLGDDNCWGLGCSIPVDVVGIP